MHSRGKQSNSACVLSNRLIEHVSAVKRVGKDRASTVDGGYDWPSAALAGGQRVLHAQYLPT